MVLNLQNSIMSYNIDKIEAKHGVFKFILNDQFIGNAINEYGEFSEIELSIMNKFIEKMILFLILVLI